MLGFLQHYINLILIFFSLILLNVYLDLCAMWVALIQWLICLIMIFRDNYAPGGNNA